VDGGQRTRTSRHPERPGRLDVPPGDRVSSRSICRHDRTVKVSVTRRASVAPRALDPLLGLVEGIDRRRRRIRPARAGALIGVERTQYRGPALDLPDGGRLDPGAAVWALHFDNARLRRFAAENGWPTRGYATAADDLRAVAARVERMPADERPTAIGGITLLAPLTRRLGFSVLPRPRTPRTRLEDWYLRSLLARWSPAGRDRLARGHGELRAAAAWMSTDALLRRYGPPPE